MVKTGHTYVPDFFSSRYQQRGSQGTVEQSSSISVESTIPGCNPAAVEEEKEGEQRKKWGGGGKRRRRKEEIEKKNHSIKLIVESAVLMCDCIN